MPLDLLTSEGGTPDNPCPGLLSLCEPDDVIAWQRLLWAVRAAVRGISPLHPSLQQQRDGWLAATAPLAEQEWGFVDLYTGDSRARVDVLVSACVDGKAIFDANESLPECSPPNLWDAATATCVAPPVPEPPKPEPPPEPPPPPIPPPLPPAPPPQFKPKKDDMWPLLLIGGGLALIVLMSGDKKASGSGYRGRRF